MDSQKTRTLPPLDRATPDQLEEALCHWDELQDNALVTLASHPRSAKQLAGLRIVEGWMREQAEEADRAEAERFDAGDCPDADELYDFGRGPGASDLGEVREEVLARHLEGCRPCAELVATLRTAPPLPLDVSPEVASDWAAEPARPLRPSATWRPFLVAASLAGLMLVPFFLGGGSDLGDFPQESLLRGPGEVAHFPRHKLLALPSGPEGTLLANPYFEFEALEGSGEYRVEVRENDGGPFEEGVRIQDLRGRTPALAGAGLPVGSFSWRASADVNGLEREVVFADFLVVEDPSLAARVTGLTDAAEHSEVLDVIHLLHEAGFIADARTLARRLPASPERGRYLGLSGD